MSEEKESGFGNNKPRMAFQHVIIFQKIKEKRCFFQQPYIRNVTKNFHFGERKKGAKEEKDPTVFE